ncbi:MAG TPA: hypothetical protein VK283_10645 [Acidimicrobiales bacterium]|nr:hypothetical protein [Acidimicrobiales bacterium]
MTLGALNDLPPTINAKAVAELFGCSTWALYETVKAGSCPVEPLRVGRKLRWPTALVLRALGLGDD